jgi:uncharacterized protein
MRQPRGLLADGAAGPKDPVRANQLFTKGCDANVAVACKLLGDAYLHGEGVVNDAKRAGELYKKACRGGSARACRAVQNLGAGAP